MHRRPVYIYLLNVPSFSSRYFNKIKRTSRLGRLLALSLVILYIWTTFINLLFMSEFWFCPMNNNQDGCQNRYSRHYSGPFVGVCSSFNNIFTCIVSIGVIKNKLKWMVYPEGSLWEEKRKTYMAYLNFIKYHHRYHFFHNTCIFLNTLSTNTFI